MTGSEWITRDTAERAIQLTSVFHARADVEDIQTWKTYFEIVKPSDFANAMLEIAGTANRIFYALPNKESLGDEVFNTFVLDRFEFPSNGSMPILKTSVADSVRIFVEEFQLDDVGATPHF